MKYTIKNILREEENVINYELQYAIQDIVDKVYPHIANNLGKSIYVDETPPVELHRDIYARYSGEPEAEGEHSSTSKAEYEYEVNKIFIYYPNMEDEEDIIRSLLHEYTHSLQDPHERKGHREEGYENDPDEIAAAEAELNWKDYLQYLPDNLNEHEDIPDWKDEIIQGDNEYKKIADELDRINITIPVNIDDGEEPKIGITDITFTLVRPFIFKGLKGDFFDVTPEQGDKIRQGQSPPTVIKYDLVFRGVEPGSFLEELLDDNSIEGEDGLDARERLMVLLDRASYEINGTLIEKYFKLYGITIGRLGTVYDSKALTEQHGFDFDNWQEDKPFSKQTHDDTKLNVPPATIIQYLDDTHRERLLKELMPILSCIEYNCYDGWKDDPDNEWHPVTTTDTLETDVGFDEMAQQYCGDCEDELNAELEKLDQDLVKLGFAQEHDSEGYDDQHRKTWLEKPFPYSYILWIDGVVKEINPRFYVDSEDNVSYVEDHMRNQTTLFEHEEKLNPELMIGDEIMVVSTEGIHDFGAPELYKPYVVVGIKHGTTINRELHKWTHGEEDEEQTPDRWDSQEVPRSRLGFRKEFDTIPYTYYQIEPIGETDKERLGHMLAGGGRRKPMYIFPTPSETHRGNDHWILRPGFRRGETWVPKPEAFNEHKESKLNPELEEGDIIRVIDVDDEYDPHMSNPDRFGVYKVLRKVYAQRQNWEGPDVNRVWYEIILLDDDFEGYTDDVLTPVIKHLYWGDTWIYADVDRKTINEHKQPGLNPELEEGDTILIIDIDRERENGKTMYSSPSPELRPERYIPYTVAEKESAGHKSEWPFKYTLVPEGEIEITGRNHFGEAHTNVKLLYPWIYQWIYGDTPTATKVDRKTISEHKETRVSPDLDKGDIIRVIEIDGEHANMPDIWGVYKVHGISQDNATQEFYYQLSGETAEVIQDRLMNAKYLYHGDTWIYADVDRKTISEPKESKLNPELMVGDEILVVDTSKSPPVNLPQLYVPYVVTAIEYPNVPGSSMTSLHPTYRLDLLDRTDNEYSFSTLADGVRVKDLYLNSIDDNWILRPGFLRGAHEARELNEQDEQGSLSPIGDWEFPVGWEDNDDYSSDIKINVPEPVFKKIMEMWDKNGIDFSIFKLLGVRYESVTQTFVLKRYIQNTKKPIPVSITYDCLDLKEFFYREDRDHDLSYIPEYLCGEDSFWESEDWYNYEWDTYMVDAIDENNWKTIMGIFGVDSQEVAENILTEQPQNEEEEELQEEHQEDIDEIQNYILWANSDETEYATKDAMAKDIDDKIEEHFGGDGQMHTDATGRKSWVIEGDLRDYVNDIWDNTEDVFEYHPDYRGEMLEGIMLDMGGNRIMPDTIFKALMDEEYAFWDYCEGKQGECLEVDSKFFDGYWYPNIDINQSLSDRLGELTYEPQITTGPEGEIKPLHEAQEDSETGEDLETHLDAADGYIEPGEFTATEVRILNLIVKRFPVEELNTIATIDDSQYPMDLYNKWRDTLKLFGENTDDKEDYGKSTRFAKWIVDNLAEATSPEDESIDFGRVTNPVKAWPSTYEVDGTEDGWEQVFRSGTIDIVAYDKDDAEDRAIEAWWEYDPDMETSDYGDYDSGDFNIDDVRHFSVLKEENEKEGPQLDETPFTPLDINILNRLATMFDRDTLRNIWKEDESQLLTDVYQKYENLMKLYGEKSNSEWSFAKSTRFAKWADDNWDEAKRIKEIELGDDYVDVGVGIDIDFGKVTNPVKEWPHQYEVEATESYWAKEYRYGSTIIPAYDEQNAEDRATSSWWEWDVDMEYGDQGDTDDHELEVDSVQYYSTLKEQTIETIDPASQEQSPDLEIGDKIMVWDLEPDYQQYHDPEVENIPRTLIGTVVDSLDDDEIDSLTYRGGIKYMIRDDSSGEEYGLYRGEIGSPQANFGDVEGAIYHGRDKWIKLPKKTLQEIKNNLNYYMRLSENTYPFIKKQVGDKKLLTPYLLNKYINLYKENCEANSKFLKIDKDNLINLLENDGIRIAYPESHLINYKDSFKIPQIIKEHGSIPPSDEPPEPMPEFPDWMMKFLVVAFFVDKGGWGRTPVRFKLYMKPSGEIVKTETTASMTSLPEQFKVGKMITFGDLLNFENNSRFDLQMKGRLRESFISPNGKKLIEKVYNKIEITPQKQYFLKRLLKESMGEDEIEQLLTLAQETKHGWKAGEGRKEVFEFLNKVRESGLINMYQSPDFLISGSIWLRKYIDLHQPQDLEPIDEYEDSDITIQHKETIQYLLDYADSVRDVIISNVMGRLEARGEESWGGSIESAQRLMRPAARDMFKLWAQYFAS